MKQDKFNAPVKSVKKTDSFGKKGDGKNQTKSVFGPKTSDKVATKDSFSSKVSRDYFGPRTVETAPQRQSVVRQSANMDQFEKEYIEFIKSLKENAVHQQQEELKKQEALQEEADKEKDEEENDKKLKKNGK